MFLLASKLFAVFQKVKNKNSAYLGEMLSSDSCSYPHPMFSQLTLWCNWRLTVILAGERLLRSLSGSTNEVFWSETPRILKIWHSFWSRQFLSNKAISLGSLCLHSFCCFIIFPCTPSFLLFPFVHNLLILKYSPIKLCLFASLFQATHVCRKVIDHFFV